MGAENSYNCFKINFKKIKVTNEKCLIELKTTNKARIFGKQ